MIPTMSANTGSIKTKGWVTLVLKNCLTTSFHGVNQVF